MLTQSRSGLFTMSVMGISNDLDGRRDTNFRRIKKAAVTPAQASRRALSAIKVTSAGSDEDGCVRFQYQYAGRQ
jgi:hypothetical protein